jgi:putative exosortase-associated protein (TIGR04073 family)
MIVASRVPSWLAETAMKRVLAAALVFGFAVSSQADIQDPPSNQYGPTRKLGRGLSNVVFGVAELPVTIARINEREGNSAAAGYGVVRGVGRSYMRFHTGLAEIFSFPFPVNRGTYYPFLRSRDRYIHAGYEEFPPELGNESKYPYVRKY